MAPSRRRRSTAPFVAVGLVASTPLLLDGATALTATIATVFSLVALGVSLSASRRMTASTRTIWLGTLVCIATALGLCRVPCNTLTWLGHPERAVLARRALQLLGASADVHCSISVDPGATARATATAVGCLAALITGTFVARSRGSSFVLGAIGFGAAAVALVTYAHAAFGLRAIYGLYTPDAPDLALPGPVINPNHLAGLMALAVPCALALARRTNRVATRMFATLAATLAAAMGVTAHSRGGAAAVLMGLGLSIVMLLRDRRRGAESRRIVQLAIGMLAIPTALLLVFLEGHALATLFRDKAYKTQLIADSLAFALRQGPLGVGRGAFAAAYAVHTGPLGRATYPETILAQWVAELGLVIGGLVLAAFAFTLLDVVRTKGSRTSERLGVVGLAVLVAQNLGDYSLEMPGIAMCASLVLGAVSARLGDVPLDGVTRDRALIRRLPVFVAIALGIVVLPLAYRWDLVRQLDARGHAPVRAALSRTEWAEVITAHPMEPTVYLAAASRARDVDSDATLGFVNLARRSAPRWTAPHIQAYLYLARRGRTSQAIGEVATIAASIPALGAQIACMVPPRSFVVDRWLRAVPERDAATFVREFARCVATDRLLELTRALVDEHPSDIELASELIRFTLIVEGPSRAQSELDARVERLGDQAEFDVWAAELALRADAPDRAIHVIAAARRAHRSSPTFDVTEAIAYSRTRDVAHTEQALARIERRLTTVSEAAWLERFRAGCEVALGRPERAIPALERSYVVDANPDVLVDIARLAAQQGRPMRSEAAVRQLCVDFPTSPQCIAATASANRP